jgi:uncharacterized protein
MPRIQSMMAAAFLATMFTTSTISAQGGASITVTRTENVERSVLVFTRTTGFRHRSIDAGTTAITELGREHGFQVTSTEDPAYFSDARLAEHDAVVFLSTTLTVLDDTQKQAFKRYIRSGGGFVGIHSATDTEYDWPWYGELVGAWFDNHPPGVIDAAIEVVDASHPATAHLPQRWERRDEWYNFGYMNANVNVLLKLDTDSYLGSDHPGNHPVAWYHEFDGGRSFYTALGHSSEAFSEALFLQHLLGGIFYAMGEE